MTMSELKFDKRFLNPNWFYLVNERLDKWERGGGDECQTVLRDAKDAARAVRYGKEDGISVYTGPVYEVTAVPAYKLRDRYLVGSQDEAESVRATLLAKAGQELETTHRLWRYYDARARSTEGDDYDRAYAAARAEDLREQLIRHCYYGLGIRVSIRKVRDAMGLPDGVDLYSYEGLVWTASKGKPSCTIQQARRAMELAYRGAERAVTIAAHYGEERVTGAMLRDYATRDLPTRIVGAIDWPARALIDTPKRAAKREWGDVFGLQWHGQDAWSNRYVLYVGEPPFPYNAEPGDATPKRADEMDATEAVFQLYPVHVGYETALRGRLGRVIWMADAQGDLVLVNGDYLSWAWTYGDVTFWQGAAKSGPIYVKCDGALVGAVMPIHSVAADDSAERIVRDKLLRS